MGSAVDGRAAATNVREIGEGGKAEGHTAV